MFQLGHDFSAMDTVMGLAYGGSYIQFQLGHDFSAMDTLENPSVQGMLREFQLGHDFSAMDTAAMFRPLLLSKKSRFSRTSLTYTYILMELTLSKRLFRYALTFHAPPRVSDTTQVRETGTFSVPEIHPSGPDGPAGQGACSQIKQFYSYFLMFKSVTVAFSDDQTTVAPRSDSCGVTPIDPALPITIPSSGPRSIIIILS